MKKVIAFTGIISISIFNYANHYWHNEEKQLTSSNEKSKKKQVNNHRITSSSTNHSKSQNTSKKHNIVSFQTYPFSPYFEEAYKLYPLVPRGILEATSYTLTRINHMDTTSPASCTGMPRVYGVMGLMLDGKRHFRNNLIYISQLSSISTEDIIKNPKSNILAYAAAYSKIKSNLKLKDNNIESDVIVLKELSEIPNDTLQSDFPLNSHIYSVLKFLNDTSYQRLYHFPAYQINFSKVFGETNYKVLNAKNIIRFGNTYKAEDGAIYINNYKN